MNVLNPFFKDMEFSDLEFLDDEITDSSYRVGDEVGECKSIQINCFLFAMLS